jgi:hypothetical protein
LIDLVHVARIGDNLDPLDGLSEATVVRAAEQFAAEGFWVHWGLPNVGYGTRFPGIGLTQASGIRSEESVYHGDPPGPHWLAGLGFRLWGSERLVLTRLIPAGVGITAVVVFASALARTLGPARAVFAYALCLATPMFTNMTHSLYYHGYTHGLLLCQLAMLLRMFSGDGSARVGSLIGLGWLGFAQGWMSYAYCGPVAFAALPIALVITPADRALPWRQVLAAILVPGFGFVLAHLLHFGQSVLYFGDLEVAIKEQLYRASKTYWIAGTFWRDKPHWMIILLGLRMMAEAFLRWTHIAAPTSLLVLGATVAALTLSRIFWIVRPRWWFAVTFAVGLRQAVGVFLAFAAAVVWVFLKPHHAVCHMSVVGRTLILPVIACAILLAVAVKVRRGRMPRIEEASS